MGALCNDTRTAFVSCDLRCRKGLTEFVPMTKRLTRKTLEEILLGLRYLKNTRKPELLCKMKRRVRKPNVMSRRSTSTTHKTHRCSDMNVLVKNTFDLDWTRNWVAVESALTKSYPPQPIDTEEIQNKSQSGLSQSAYGRKRSHKHKKTREVNQVVLSEKDGRVTCRSVVYVCIRRKRWNTCNFGLEESDRQSDPRKEKERRFPRGWEERTLSSILKHHGHLRVLKCSLLEHLPFTGEGCSLEDVQLSGANLSTRQSMENR